MTPPLSLPTPAEHRSGAATLHCFASQFLDNHTEQLNWSLDYDQLDRGRFEGAMLEVRLPGIQLFRESTSRALRQRGGVQTRAVGVARMSEGNGTLHFQGREANGRLVVCGPDQDIDMRTPPGCTLVGIVVDADLIAHHAQMDGMSSRWEADTLVAETGPHDSLIHFVAHSLDIVASRPQLIDDARAMAGLRDSSLLHFINTLSQAPESDAPMATAARQRVVDHACSLMLARPDDPPSLLEICEKVAVSPRKLGYCFQEVLGQSPQAFLRVLRLNTARRELSRLNEANTSVYDIAARWGFWHFGRFSTEYKAHFGESPSETLKRGRARREWAAA